LQTRQGKQVCDTRTEAKRKGSGRFKIFFAASRAERILRRGRFSAERSFRSWQEQERKHQMNWNQVEGNWEQVKGSVQKQWGKLTGDDIDVIAGNRKQLAGKLQERYGKAQEEAERDIDTWLSSRH
jgi:uncharacterized protein YjbJ (UPF0337 family)